MLSSNIGKSLRKKNELRKKIRNFNQSCREIEELFFDAVFGKICGRERGKIARVKRKKIDFHLSAILVFVGFGKDPGVSEVISKFVSLDLL